MLLLFTITSIGNNQERVKKLTIFFLRVWRSSKCTGSRDMRCTQRFALEVGGPGGAIRIEEEGISMKCALLGVILLFSACALTEELSDSEVKKILIEQSIRSYSGSCPCPYNRAQNGSRCGGRSAYSRPGGASPLCYDSDITTEMVERYRKSNE